MSVMTTIRMSALLLLLAIAVSGCVFSGKRIKGNGRLTTETRSVADFEDLVLEGPMEVYLSQGSLEAARISAESNIQPYIKLEHRGDKLVVGFRNHISLSTTRQIKLYLSVPRLQQLNAVGSGTIKVQDTLKSDGKITLRITGSGNIELFMNAPELAADIIGSGNIEVGGDTREVSLNILGSGDFKGKDLKSETASVKIAGSGDATLFASIKLKSTILGSGDVYYLGDPSLETSTTGSGKVIQKVN